MRYLEEKNKKRVIVRHLNCSSDLAFFIGENDGKEPLQDQEEKMFPLVF